MATSHTTFGFKAKGILFAILVMTSCTSNAVTDDGSFEEAVESAIQETLLAESNIEATVNERVQQTVQASQVPDIVGTPMTVESTPDVLEVEPIENATYLLAQQGVRVNNDWEPYSEVIAGVEMALVPAGCFLLGDNVTGFDDESPVYEFCIDLPFWIDVYEVSNEQYGSSGYFRELNRPREDMTWHEALEHCESRGARLPTEPEWEYSASGPDGWIYPWGDAFDSSKLVFINNSKRKTEEVGSYPKGASWVGAMDMSGNVWEWVNTLYGFYPYDDEFEDASGTNPRVMRGGSWNDRSEFVRTANRGQAVPTSHDGNIGFRCVSDF